MEPVSAYLDVLQRACNWSSATPLFVATTDAAALQFAREAAGRDGFRLVLNEHVSHVDAEQRREQNRQSNGGSYSSFALNGSQRVGHFLVGGTGEDDAMEALRDMRTLVRAQASVVSFSSNMGRFAYSLSLVEARRTCIRSVDGYTNQYHDGGHCNLTWCDVLVR